MPKKKHIEKTFFGWKPTNYVNGVPWPRLNVDAHENNNVPLKENYLMRSMDYLDTEEAKIIFEEQADIIEKNNIKGIVDVGCRVGRINNVLHERGYLKYKYMGFDTSIEPIKYSQKVWEEFDNIEFRCANWDDKSKISVKFNVDCVIWSGVLLYRPKDHQKLFHDITVNFYDAKYAIIQEPMREQEHWLKGLSLHTIAEDLDSYKNRYSFFKEKVIKANLFSGNRKIVEIKI